MPHPSIPLRRNRDFQLLWVGQALSALGSRVSPLDGTSAGAVVAVFTVVMAGAVCLAASSRAIRPAPSFHAVGPQEPPGDDALLARA